MDCTGLLMIPRLGWAEPEILVNLISFSDSWIQHSRFNQAADGNARNHVAQTFFQMPRPVLGVTDGFTPSEGIGLRKKPGKSTVLKVGKDGVWEGGAGTLKFLQKKGSVYEWLVK